MCLGVGPSGLPMLMSITSSPARRAAIFSSLVMLKTYGGRRLMRANSLMGDAKKLQCYRTLTAPANLEAASRVAQRPEHVHRLRRRLRGGERREIREEPRGAPRAHRRRLAGAELRRPQARALRRPRRPRPRDRPPGNGRDAALPASRGDRSAARRRHRRGGDGSPGRLPYLQHPRGRRAQGRGGAADRMTRRALLALFAVFALAWSGNLGYRHLIKPDEGRYAEIPREMVASGDWLTPRIDGYKYFEKPPLQYWATAAAFSAFGLNEWAARLWPGLTGFLGVLLVFWAGNRLFGPPAGLFGAAVTASSFLYAVIGHLLTLDMALSVFMSAAVFGFAVSQAKAGDARRRRMMLLAWGAMALAVLTKGLAGAILPVA